jgi:protein involved in polysaccharide export with SLBB domain
MVCLLLGVLGTKPVPAAESYQLANAPTNAVIDKNGIITWTPTQAQAPSTNTVTMILADAGQAAPAENSLSLSGTSASKRAHWAEHLTLGAGDTLNLSLFDMPDTARTDVPVGPDGRITFLQARNVMAAGMTIDELRAKLDEMLGKYYQNPHTMIVPVAFRSKKYFVLGAVTAAGVYTMERPLTVIEAIARAGGFQTGLSEQRTVELADLGHSFIVRDRQRLPVDFERLFQRGDLTQNVALEPEDFLYFASAGANEIYVLGEVSSPGVLLFAPHPTVLKAIASRGGFADRAFKSRVLVVRGSLSHPQTFVVNTTAILHGKAPDFKLQPRDIVYVSKNPWVVGAEVLDSAAKAFIQGMFVEYTTLRVGPLITQPLIK